MLYREAGDFKTSYRADTATFPIGSMLAPPFLCFRPQGLFGERIIERV